MRKILKNLQEGATIGIGFLLIVFLGGAVYAAWDYSTTVNTSEPLTAEMWNSVKDKVVSNDSIITANAAGIVPSGAVMSFNLASCPTGWSEYTQAYGRVIRGIDKSGTNIDPDGQRALGNLQADDFKAHDHGVWFGVPNSAGWASGFHGFAVGASFHNGDPEAIKETSESTGGTETRSKNVALLYCQKD